MLQIQTLFQCAHLLYQKYVVILYYFLKEKKLKISSGYSAFKYSSISTTCKIAQTSARNHYSTMIIRHMY